MSRQHHLDSRIRVVNKAHDLANQYITLIIEALTPFLGKPVIDDQGKFLPDVQLPELPPEVIHQVHPEAIRFRVSAEVPFLFDMPDLNLSNERYSFQVHVGHVEDGVLVEFLGFHPLRTDFDYDTFAEKATQYRIWKSMIEEEDRKRREEFLPLSPEEYVGDQW